MIISSFLGTSWDEKWVIFFYVQSQTSLWIASCHCLHVWMCGRDFADMQFKTSPLLSLMMIRFCSLKVRYIYKIYIDHVHAQLTHSYSSDCPTSSSSQIHILFLVFLMSLLLITSWDQLVFPICTWGVWPPTET